jgi:hypothetical protein
MADAVEVDGYLVEFRILGFATDTEELVADILLAKPDPEYFRTLLGLDDLGELLAGAYPLSEDKLKDLSEGFGFPLPQANDRPVVYTLEANQAE